jgi:multiple sugar transport system substrate-binding protein
MNFKKLGAIVLSSMVLVGCSEGINDQNHGLDKNNPITINVGTLDNDTTLQTLVDTYNTTIGNDRGINIVYNQVSTTEQLSSMDIISSDYDTIYSLCSTCDIAELSDYYDSMDLGSTYLREAVEEVSLSGLRAIPTKLDMNVLAVNQTLWNDFSSANGFENTSLETWDSLLNVAETYYEQDSKTFLGISSSYDVAMELSYQTCNPLVEITSEGASIDVSSDYMQVLWDTIATPEIKGLYTATNFESFQNGDVVAIYCPISELPDDDNILVLQAPYSIGEDYMLDVTAMAVNSTDDTTIYASVDFIDWLTTPDINYQYAVNGGYVPSNLECQKVSNMKEYLYNGDTTENTNSNAELLALSLIDEGKVFKVSPFDNVSTLETILETRVNQNSSHDIIVKRQQGGILEDKLYEGILDGDSFKTWYDDICDQLKATFSSNNS